MEPTARSDANSRANSLQGEALVDGAGQVWLPFDLPHLQQRGIGTQGWSRLSEHRPSRHAGRSPFEWRLPEDGTLRVLNGMGITLGDSVIGLNALAWLKAQHPGLRIQLYRSPHAPAFVERLYQLATRVVDEVSYLPQPLAELPEDTIDLSDFLHWPLFAHEPMVDMFCRGLGLQPQEVPAWAKANRWMAPLPRRGSQTEWAERRYVLFCDQASTPLRTVPHVQARAMVDRIWRRYGRPVLGFREIDHPHYLNIAKRSRNLDEFIHWVRGAAAMIGTDSSAIHIAAAFDVPTLAVFVSIDPQLRVRDYPQCRALDARTPLTEGLHQSDDPALLREVEGLWAAVVARPDLPWPEALPLRRSLSLMSASGWARSHHQDAEMQRLAARNAAAQAGLQGLHSSSSGARPS